jgi:hypothetical protein
MKSRAIKKLIPVLFLLVLPLLASAADVNSAPGSIPLMLGGKLGIGGDQLDGEAFEPAVRYWLNENTALECVFADYNGSGTIGLGVIQNIIHPTRDVYIHLLGRITYDDFFEQIYTAFSAGLGCEVFMPFCEDLSLDGWVGEEINYEYDAASGGFFNFGTLTASFGSPLNLAIHAYF